MKEIKLKIVKILRSYNPKTKIGSKVKFKILKILLSDKLK